ncbi:hypothetical protein K8I28_08550 [bacterium]|nr:hypothetical protein [bacterium]
MMRYSHRVYLYILLFSCLPFIHACATDPPDFSDRQTAGTIEHNSIKEASGMVASRANPGIFWIINDSGNEAVVYGCDEHGKHRAKLILEGVHNRDWEDIAVGTGEKDGTFDIYVGEIGDNRAHFENIALFRFEEPILKRKKETIHIPESQISVMRLKYPDGPRDAETLLVDPISNEVVIVSKRELNVRAYQTNWKNTNDDVVTLEYLGDLPLYNVVGGDISPDGSGILLKTYASMFYWFKKPGEDFINAFSKQGHVLPYVEEVQGESVCWTIDGSAYYTVSEERDKTPAVLYCYKMNK